ncbi:glutamate-rich protein 3 isoform X2 [Anolis carolinensis]|uniref:glutamate-rich protein 3 isoform X2 n=1 Tax=Anolis carolinensis TaxID=28377 RepID=UPI002F2B2ECF
MSHRHPKSLGDYNSLAHYNSLTDKHLAGYFSNTRIRRHLLRSGLVSRSGRIISEKEYQLNAMRKDHQKYIRECLAQAIFHKVLDMERQHQAEIKRKLENSVRKERVQKLKVERSRKAAEESNRVLSPHPPSAPRNRARRRKLRERGEMGNVASYPRPSTAPGKIQQPLRLQPLYGNISAEFTPKATSTSRAKFLTLEREHQFPNGGDKGSLRPIRSTEYSSGVSPYHLPIINNFVIPIPLPPPPKSEKITSTMKGGTLRGRRFRPTTALDGLEQLLMRDTGKFYRPQVHSNAYLTMIYLGKPVHLSYELFDYREEIKIYQQHCGGENLCVFRGKLLEGETFHFISRRHYGFPFSLTFYLNGIQVDRVSSCCEYKHRKGTRLGGKHGHFGFVNVERSAPCYRCIISMGLDKKPSPPKRKTTDEDEAKKEDSEKEDKDKRRESSRSGEDKQELVSRFSPAPEERKSFAEGAQVMEWETKKEKIRRSSDETETYQRPSAYDEDFEADEEKSDEKVNEEGQADDQMNGMSKSPSDDEKDNLDHERENKISSQKALRASDSEQDESDGYGESDFEGEDKQGKKLASPSSSILYSNENISDSETRKQVEEQDNVDIHSEYESEMAKSQRSESQEMDIEEEETMGEVEHTRTKRMSGISDEDKMETSLQDMSTTYEKGKMKGLVDMNMKEGMEEDITMHFRHSSPEEKLSSLVPSEDEEGECKSVKEKIAEAIEHDQLLSSEPEPSDSSTEDEEDGATATQDKHEGGIFMAKKSKALKSKKAAEQLEQERQMVFKKRAPEEEELVEEEYPEEATLEEEFLAKKAVAHTAKQAIKDRTVSRETDVEEELESDLDDIEKEVTDEEGNTSDRKIKGERKVKKIEVMAAEHETFDGDVISGKSQLGREGVKDPNLTKELIGIGKGTEGEEDIEELTRRKSMKEEGHKAKKILKGTIETGEALGTEFEEEAQKDMKEAESEGHPTLQELKHKTEGVERASSVEHESLTASGLMDDEYMEKKKYMKLKLGESDSKAIEFTTRHEKVGEEIYTEEVTVAAAFMWTKDLEKASPEKDKTKSIFTAEDSAQRKQEPFTESIPEGIGLVTGKIEREREAQEMADSEEVVTKRKVVKGETEADYTKTKGTEKEKVDTERVKREAEAEEEVEDEETKRLLKVKWEMKSEDSETEGEVMSLVTESEGEQVSKMTFMRWQNVVNMREDAEAKANYIPKPSSQKVTVLGLNRKMRMENESCPESEVEETPEETAAGQKTVYSEVQTEEETEEEVNEDEESSTEEQMPGEEMITLADVEQALLIGIQQLITEVSRINEDEENKEEESQEKGLAEEMSTQEDPEKEDFVSVVVAKEQLHAENDKADKSITGETEEGNPLAENNGSEKRTSGQEESPAENVAVTKIIHWNMQQSEEEQDQNPTGSSD